MRVGSTSGVLLAVWLAAAAGPAGADEDRPEIRSLEVREVGERTLVSFAIEGAFREEVRERIQSGIPVTFVHEAELLARRPFPLLPAKVLGRTIVETTARFDSLTRQYHLERRTTREDAPDDVDAATTSTTTSAAEMERWMTVLRDVPLPAPEAGARKARVRVRSVTGRRFRLFVFPGSWAATDERLLEP